MQPRPNKNLSRLLNQKFLPLLVIIFLNLLILLIFGSYAVWRTYVDVYEVQPVSVTVPPPVIPPVTPPPTSGGEASTTPEDPQPVVAPPPTALNVATTMTTSSFNLNSTKLVNDAIASASKIHGMANATNTSTGTHGLSATGFGNLITENYSGPTYLTGYFYDLKQSKERKNLGMNKIKWLSILSHFIASGWNESELDNFFKSKNALSTSIFAITNRKSAEAPKAFGLENKVLPDLWAIYYQGTVSADDTGDYQFVGYGDDLLGISMDGHLVLDGGYHFLTNDPTLHQTYPNLWSKKVGKLALLRKGRVFHMDAGVPKRMQVLIGDEGGLCGYYLLLQKVGNTYKKETDGTPILPFFRLNDVIPKMDDGEHPNYEPTGPIWNSVTQAGPTL